MNADDPARLKPRSEPVGEAATLRHELEAAQRRVAELSAEVADLRARLDPRPDTGANGQAWLPVMPAMTAVEVDTSGTLPPQSVDRRSPSDAKIALYRSLFAGRDDVFARRWENTARGTHGWAPARAGAWTLPREQRASLPFTDDVVRAHLEGRATIGLYPLLPGDRCRLLACDFDKATWRLDPLAYVEAATAAGVPVALERSRSGNGAHVWTFFTGSVPASDAGRWDRPCCERRSRSAASLSSTVATGSSPLRTTYPSVGSGT